MFLSIQADFQLSTMQIGLNWKIALKWTFFINMNALKAIILCIFGVGMCPESLGQKKFFEIFFVTFTVESTICNYKLLAVLLFPLDSNEAFLLCLLSSPIFPPRK